MHIDCTIGDPSFYEGRWDRRVFVRWVGDDGLDKRYSRKERIMYEPSRQVLTFTIAGFSHWYGIKLNILTNKRVLLTMTIKNESLDEILPVIGELTGIRWEWQDDTTVNIY